MNIKKALKGLKEEAECKLWRLEEILEESWKNIRSSGRAKSAAAMSIPALAFSYWLTPKLAYTQEADEQQFLCGLPENTSAEVLELRNKVLELMQKEKVLMLNVKAGETIATAIGAYASSYGDPTRKTFIDEETWFVTKLGWNPNLIYLQQCDVPVCTSLNGCNPLELIARAEGETAAGPAPIVTVEAEVTTAETPLASPEAGLQTPPPPVILQMYNPKDFIQFLWEAKADRKTHDYINDNFGKYDVVMTEYIYETRLGVGAAGAKKRKMDVFYVDKGYADSGIGVAAVRYDENGMIVDINEGGRLDGSGAGRDAGKTTPFLVSNWSVRRGQGMVNLESTLKTLLWLYLAEEGMRAVADPNAPTIYNGYGSDGGDNPPPVPPPVQPAPPGPHPGNP